LKNDYIVISGIDYNRPYLEYLFGRDLSEEDAIMTWYSSFGVGIMGEIPTSLMGYNRFSKDVTQHLGELLYVQRVTLLVFCALFFVLLFLMHPTKRSNP
jgi:hypothetical protein